MLLDFQNSPQFVIGYYAILRADAFVVPVNPMLRTDELRHYVGDSGARIVLCAQDNWPQFEPLLAGSPDGIASFEHALVGAYADALTSPTDLVVPDFVRAANAVATTRARDALERRDRRRVRAGARAGRTGRLVRDAVHVGHDRASRRDACTRTAR